MKILKHFPTLLERTPQDLVEEICVPLLMDNSDHASVPLNSVMAAVFGLIIAEAGDGPIYHISSESESGLTEESWREFQELEGYPVECGITTYSVYRAKTPQGKLAAIGFHEGVPFSGEMSIQYWDIFVLPGL